jgi:branched-chain amino acid transport system permease protein
MMDLLSYGAFFMTMALTYSIICLGLNVQWGQTGLFNVGISGFVAIGAYVSALLTTPDAANRFGGFELPIYIGWLGAAAATGLATFLVGALTIKLRADYLAIATFGVAVVVQLCLLNLEPLTGGPFGIGFIRVPSQRPLRTRRVRRPTGLLVVLVAVVYLGWKGSCSPWGRADGDPGGRDGGRCASKNAVSFRLQAFAIGGTSWVGRRRWAFHQVHRAGQLFSHTHISGLGDADRGWLRKQQRRHPRSSSCGVYGQSRRASSPRFPGGQMARCVLQIVLIGVSLCAILARPRGILGEVGIVSRHVAQPSAIAGGVSCEGDHECRRTDRIVLEAANINRLVAAPLLPISNGPMPALDPERLADGWKPMARCPTPSTYKLLRPAAGRLIRYPKEKGRRWRHEMIWRVFGCWPQLTAGNLI